MGESTGGPGVIFFDGGCGFCDRWVRWVMERDEEQRFRFAPLGGETFHARLAAERRATLGDSVVVLTADGRVLQRSAALLHVLRSLGGGWSFLAALGSLAPAFLGDGLYAHVARRRHLLAPAPDACPRPTDDQRARLDP